MAESRDQHRYDDMRRSINRVNRLMNWAEVSFPRPVTPSEYIQKKVLNERKLIEKEEEERAEKEREQKRTLDVLTRQMNLDLMNQKEQEREEKRRAEREVDEKIEEKRREEEEKVREMREYQQRSRVEFGKILKRQEVDQKKKKGHLLIGDAATTVAMTISDDGTVLYPEIMTPVERGMNKLALDAVKEDPVLKNLFQSRLSHRLRMSARGSGAGGSLGAASAGGGESGRYDEMTLRLAFSLIFFRPSSLVLSVAMNSMALNLFLPLVGHQQDLVLLATFLHSLCHQEEDNSHHQDLRCCLLRDRPPHKIIFELDRAQRFRKRTCLILSLRLHRSLPSAQDSVLRKSE
jgi:hypothetical protein